MTHAWHHDSKTAHAESPLVAVDQLPCEEDIEAEKPLSDRDLTDMEMELDDEHIDEFMDALRDLHEGDSD